MASVLTEFHTNGTAQSDIVVPSRNGAKSRMGAPAGWTYEEAFKRNRGLITEPEQEKLRNSRVAIAGMGGVGGVHLVTLARLGIGKFTIADPDVFEVANFNRQYGATVSNLGRNKAEAMAEVALDINPELDLRVMPQAINKENVDELLRDADLVVDGLDLYAIDARRRLFSRASSLGTNAITVAPMGFSTCWLIFEPNAMSFDQYFDVRDEMAESELFAAFIAGLSPKMKHLRYLNTSHVDPSKRCAPSASIGCQLATGVMGAQAVKLLLAKGKVRSAPYYYQFDAYLGTLVQKRLFFANRHPWQRAKRWWIKRLWQRRFDDQLLGKPKLEQRSEFAFDRAAAVISEGNHDR